eukprot:CAMPEP_0195521952 /NCGR_PEP_ID=MMETSP0794_2-20130614/19740_1 /TAXON_ID=515487 /ORGANISM="Stephanopyxis turris, Strain CCMP 815" /LENGTH=280 /DNA_ID=CAMNT_0040651615 /DNA_START=204 /DNA_END=1047 /DNA_ORIENTATION=-
MRVLSQRVPVLVARQLQADPAKVLFAICAEDSVAAFAAENVHLAVGTRSDSALLQQSRLLFILLLRAFPRSALLLAAAAKPALAAEARHDHGGLLVRELNDGVVAVRERANLTMQLALHYFLRRKSDEMFLVRSDSSEMHWLDCNKELQSPAKHFTVYSPVFAFSTIFLVLIWFSMEIRKHSGQAAWPHGLKDPLIAPASMSSPQNVHSSSSSSFKEKSFSGRHISFLHSPHTTLLRTILCGPGFCAAEQAKHSSCDRSTKDDPQSAQACRSVPERIWAK